MVSSLKVVSMWSGRAAWSLVLLLSLSNVCLAFPDDETVLSSASVEITYRPREIIKGLTENVTLRCSDTKNSQLRDVRGIAIKKKETSGWLLVAEHRDNGSPEALVGAIAVSGSIGHDNGASFLQITWPVATDDTFGTYLCEVTGIDGGGLTKVESTSQVNLSEGDRNITGLDLLALLRSTEKRLMARIDIKLAEQSRRIDRLDSALDSVNATLISVKDKIISGMDLASDNDVTSSKLSALSLQVNSINRTVATLGKNVNDLRKTKSVVSSGPLTHWPAGNYALLQPKTGCPRDTAFLGRPESYLRLHTERQNNMDSHSDALAPATKIKMLGLNLITLRFCEANEVTSTTRWPLGSYCINNLHERQCPDGFDQGFVHLDNEDSIRFDDHAGNVVRQIHSVNPTVLFCCTGAGSTSTPVTLPTASPFLLYRRGGRCQQVHGMTVSEENVNIDTEDVLNIDFSGGDSPDMDIQQGTTTRFYLCHYVPNN